MRVTHVRVAGFPSPDLGIDSGERWPHPRTISNLFDVDDAAHFPLLDSRTRYWRYYLLFRPGDGRQTRQALGRVLHCAIRANDPQRTAEATTGRLRGVGRGLYEPRRHLTPRQEVRVAERFRSDYGTAVKRFWKSIDGSSNEHLFVEAGARWRASQLGFFENAPMGDGHARNAFHRLLETQSPVAQEFAPLLLKDDFSDLWALKVSRVGWASFSSNEARRVFLARCLPLVLFRRPVGDPSDLDDDEESEREQGFTDWLRPLAETCVRFLTHRTASAIRGRMTAPQASELVATLRAALRRRQFEEPFPAPQRRPGQLLQTLFPGHRLNAFHRLLHATK
jgi:hypothetical protein